MIKDIENFFLKGINKKIFPGGIVGISFMNKKGDWNKEIYHFGCLSHKVNSCKVKNNTLYDLASLTKPLVIVFTLLYLIESKKIRIDENIENFLSGYFLSEKKKKITIEMLMNHCSGLPAHKPYYVNLLGKKNDIRKKFLIQKILNESLIYDPGKKEIYSDLGYILLGFLIEQIEENNLDDFFREKITKKIGVSEDVFFMSYKKLDIKKRCASTEFNSWNKKLLTGLVHDDNCRLIGGVSGHAGLFGTVRGILKMCEYFLSIYNNNLKNTLFSKQTLDRMLVRKKNSRFVCGFDTPSTIGSSSGKYFSKKSLGHLGFTGTSFWMDMEKNIIIVLLTNRVCPLRKGNKIKKFRPQLHDIIMENEFK